MAVLMVMKFDIHPDKQEAYTKWREGAIKRSLAVSGVVEFRAALNISYIQMVLVESLLGGMIISCCLSFFLLRFFDKIPTKNPVLKSVILGFVALVIVLILVQVAASRTSDALHVFLIGVVGNVPRFLFVGVVIGYLYKRLYGSA